MLGPAATPLSYSTQLRSSRSAKSEKVRMETLLRICTVRSPLFVFSLSDPKQNARSLLTPVSGTVFYALSHGSLGFALHGSFFNHLLIG